MLFTFSHGEVRKPFAGITASADSDRNEGIVAVCILYLLASDCRGNGVKRGALVIIVFLNIRKTAFGEKLLDIFLLVYHLIVVLGSER